MSKKLSVLSKKIIICSVLFIFIYFLGYGYGQTTGTATIINMRYERGIRFYKQREYDNAIKELERILEIEPQHAKAKRYLSESIKRRNKKMVHQLYKQARVYYKEKDYQKALEAYQKVLEIMPGDEYSSYNIEMLKAKIEKLDKFNQVRAKYRERQLAKELEKISKQMTKRERLLKKKAESELIRQEKQIQKNERD